MNFPTAWQLHWTSDSFADTVETECLRPIVRAYVVNLRRSLAIHELLDCTVHSTALHERARYRLRMEALKRPFIEPEDGQVAGDSLRAAAKAEWMTFRPVALPGERQAPDNPMEFGDKEDILNALTAYAGGQAAREAMLENQITRTWTAVESLYRRLGHAANEVRRDGPLAEKDLRFARLQSVRKTYKKIFDLDASPAALGDRSLEVLSALRNVPEHNVGYCDQRYRDRAKEKGDLPQLELGEKLYLTGDMTLGAIQPVIWVAQKLVTEVDERMQARL